MHKVVSEARQDTFTALQISEPNSDTIRGQSTVRLPGLTHTNVVP